MKKQLLCTKYLNNYVLINRLNSVTVKIPRSLYIYLANAQSQKSFEGNNTLLASALSQLGILPQYDNELIDKLLVRSEHLLGFGKASYEITETCNYKCLHCYLGNKKRPLLTLEEKMRLIDVIEQSGCLWLQITGGEPLSDIHFSDVYRYAYDKGLLLNVSTNLSLLNKPKLVDTFEDYPPNRVTVSLYGASEQTYEALTGNQGSFKAFMRSLAIAKEMKLRLRINIIITRFNEQELEQMQELASRFTLDYHVFPYLLPTLEGDTRPITLMARNKEMDSSKRILTNTSWRERCFAGKTFFHVDSSGRASICKTARNNSVNLLLEGVDALPKLTFIADDILELKGACVSCPLREQCATCPPLLSLYNNSNFLPNRICQYGTERG